MLNKLFQNFTRLLVLWVLLAVIFGYFYPQILTNLKPYTDWLFALTMFGIGVVLKPSDFKPLLKQPQVVLLGTLAQFAIMPAIGFLISRALCLSPELSLGMILVGAVPGAMASNVISYLAKADVAYSIALTSTSTFLAPILTPTFTYLFGRTLIEIKFWPMFISIIQIVIFPLLLGMLVKHFFRRYVEGLIDFFPALSTLFIAFICGLVVALNREHLAGITALIFLAVFLHNLLGLLLGYGAGILYRFDKKRCRTLSLEVGMQNAGLGAVLALKHFSAQSAIPNAFFATWCIVTASVLAEIWQRKE